MRDTPYGEAWLPNAAPSHQADMPGFTGHIEDSATGLTYMQARYYDPVLARFLSNDPVGFSATKPFMFGRYAYAANDPANLFDPDGRDPRWVAWVGQTASAAKRLIDDNGVTAYAGVEGTAIAGTLGYEGEVGRAYDGATGRVFDYSNSTDPLEDNLGPLVGDQPPNFGLELGINLEAGATLSPDALTSPTRNVTGSLSVIELTGKFDAETGEFTGFEVSLGLGYGVSTTVTDGQVLNGNQEDTSDVCYGSWVCQ